MLSVKAAEIKIDSCFQKGLRCWFLQDSSKQLEPFLFSQAEFGIDGHGISPAAGESANFQAADHFFRKIKKPLASLGKAFWTGIFKNQSIILVGNHRLFPAAFAAHPHPGKF